MTKIEIIIKESPDGCDIGTFKGGNPGTPLEMAHAEDIFNHLAEWLPKRSSVEVAIQLDHLSAGKMDMIRKRLTG